MSTTFNICAEVTVPGRAAQQLVAHRWLNDNASLRTPLQRAKTKVVDMRSPLLWIALAQSLAATQLSATTLAPPYTGRCLVGEGSIYPPPPRAKVAWHVVQLDLPPAERWLTIAASYKAQIARITQAIKNLTEPIMHGKITDFVDTYLATWADKLPYPYGEEIRSIANATGVPLGEVVLYNIFYELFTACTSVVAENDNGDVYAARNLDFGFLLGWDFKQHQWIVTEILRKMVINVEWTFNKKTVFKSAGFAGFIGVLTGVKPKAFSLTINERFDRSSGFEGVLKWLLNLEKSKWVTWMAREVLTKAGTYDEAIFSLSMVRLMAPVYFIVSGPEAGKGAVITRSRERTLDIRSLESSSTQNWYLLQTNYDPWVTPSPLDDRRTPGKLCMEKLGSYFVDFAGLYTVLSSKPILNKLTVHTSLMYAANGTLETYIQRCPDPCWYV